MSQTIVSKGRQKISYVLRNARKGEPVFQDVRLPDGSIVRQVDRAVHEKALRAVSEKYHGRDK